MKKKILIVDDQPEMLKMLQMQLLAANFEVAATTDGEKAIRMIQSIKPDLLILDVMLPGVDGPAIARHTRDNPATVNMPIIFLTGLLPKVEQKSQRKTDGGDYLIAKPFNIAELLDLIKKLIV